jgi:hypothetical protein
MVAARVRSSASCPSTATQARLMTGPCHEPRQVAASRRGAAQVSAWCRGAAQVGQGSRGPWYTHTGAHGAQLE